MKTQNIMAWYRLVRPGESLLPPLMQVVTSADDIKVDQIFSEAIADINNPWMLEEIISTLKAAGANVEPLEAAIDKLAAGPDPEPEVDPAQSQSPAPVNPQKSANVKAAKSNRLSMGGILSAIKSRLPNRGPNAVSKRNPLASLMKHKKIAIVILILIILGIGYMAISRGGSPTIVSDGQNPEEFVDIPNISGENVTIVPTEEVSPQSTPQNNNLGGNDGSLGTSQADQTDEDFWASLGSSEVPERSPGILGYQTATTGVGIFLMLVLSLWAFFEGKIRNNGQEKALAFSILAIFTGWVTFPVLNLLSEIKVFGWFLVVFAALLVPWSLVTAVIWLQKDKTPITISLAIFTGVLFYAGSLPIISTLGTMFDATWPAWSGVTSVAGMFTLLMAGRFTEAALTLLILVLSILVVSLSVLEVGKKQGVAGSVTIGLIIIALFLGSNFGLNYLVSLLMTTYTLPVPVIVVLKIAAPILAWAFSLVVSILIGAGMGDMEVGFNENKIQVGIKKTGGFVQNIADFGILGTIIPLFLGVINTLF